MYQAPDTNEKLEEILAFRHLLGYVNVHFLTLYQNINPIFQDTFIIGS